MIENILIVDVETNGLNCPPSQIIELGAILYSVKHKTILQCFSTLFPCDANPVQHINHISPELTNSFEYNHEWASFFAYMYQEAQAMVAHNAQFDKKFVETLDFGVMQTDTKWICTKSNFKWPSPLNRYRLQDVCHSIGVVYDEGAHRALYDANLIAKCFTKVEDLQERIDAAYDRC